MANDLYKTRKISLGKCTTCGRSVSTHVARIDFIAGDGTRHDVIQIEAQCGVPGHATRQALFTWPEMVGEA